MAAAHDFILLVEKFLAGAINAEAFADYAVSFYQQNYDDLYADEPSNNIIGDLCLDADALSNRPPYNVTPDELREAARKALDQLTTLQAERNKSA
jgi:hypothetical protein